MASRRRRDDGAADTSDEYEATPSRVVSRRDVMSSQEQEEECEKIEREATRQRRIYAGSLALIGVMLAVAMWANERGRGRGEGWAYVGLGACVVDAMWFAVRGRSSREDRGGKVHSGRVWLRGIAICTSLAHVARGLMRWNREWSGVLLSATLARLVGPPVCVGVVILACDSLARQETEAMSLRSYMYVLKGA